MTIGFRQIIYRNILFLWWRIEHRPPISGFRCWQILRHTTLDMPRRINCCNGLATRLQQWKNLTGISDIFSIGMTHNRLEPYIPGTFLPWTVETWRDTCLRCDKDC